MLHSGRQAAAESSRADGTRFHRRGASDMRGRLLLWLLLALSLAATPADVGAQPPKDSVLRIPPGAELRATLANQTAKLKVQRPLPEIVAVVVTTDQKHVEEGVSRHPYPFTGRSTINWSRYRHLLIVGRNL